MLFLEELLLAFLLMRDKGTLQKSHVRVVFACCKGSFLDCLLETGGALLVFIVIFNDDGRFLPKQLIMLTSTAWLWQAKDLVQIDYSSTVFALQRCHARRLRQEFFMVGLHLMKKCLLLFDDSVEHLMCLFLTLSHTQLKVIAFFLIFTVVAVVFPAHGFLDRLVAEVGKASPHSFMVCKLLLLVHELRAEVSEFIIIVITASTLLGILSKTLGPHFLRSLSIPLHILHRIISHETISP